MEAPDTARCHACLMLMPLQDVDEGEEEEQEASTPGTQPSERSPLNSLPHSLASTGDRGQLVLQHPAPQYDSYQVETSSRSAGCLGSRPATAAAAAAAARPATAAPSSRPATVPNGHAAEYYSRPPPTSRSVPDSEVDSTGGLHYRSAGSGTTGSGGSGGSLPAHNRLYADHFRKQQRLEEERHRRCAFRAAMGACLGLQAWAACFEVCPSARQPWPHAPQMAPCGACLICVPHPQAGRCALQ